MGWIVTIIVGFIVGVLAKLLHPGKDDLGFIMTTLLGIGGALLAGWVGQAAGWYEAGQPAGCTGRRYQSTAKASKATITKVWATCLIQ